jgi:hypothetical protein
METVYSRQPSAVSYQPGCVNCPMDIAIYENPRSVECIRCLECTACPCVEHRTVLSGLEPAATPALPVEAVISPQPSAVR